LERLLHLIQEFLLPKASQEIAVIWNKKPERNAGLLNFFAHGQNYYSCAQCSLILSRATFIDNEMKRFGLTGKNQLLRQLQEIHRRSRDSITM
jgi:hypothetical protein